MKPPILLRIYRQDHLEGVKQFDLKQIVIGHNADVQLDLNDSSVSPLHAVIEERETGYYLSDLGSQTGTLRNGQRILDEKLESGDEIKIGPFRLQFFVGVPKPAAPPAIEKPKVETPKVETPRIEKPKVEKPTPSIAAVTKPAVVEPGSVTKSQPPKVSPQAAPMQSAASMAPKRSLAAKTTKKSHRTFAPPSPFSDAREIVRPSKGTVVEVLVTWKERVIAARHFNERRVVTVGADPTSDLIVPVFPGGSKFPLVKIQNLATVSLTQDMTGEVIRDSGTVTLAELFKQNRMRSVGSLYEFDLPQGEMIRIAFQSGLVSVLVRYVPDTPKPLVAPILDLTASEVTGVILAGVVVAIFGLYMMIYSPANLEDQAKVEEPLRKAVVTFNPPKPKTIIKVEDTPMEEKKVVKVAEKQPQRMAQNPTVEAKGKPGQAGEVAPKDSKDKQKKLTSARPGGAVKTSPTEGASAASQKPDPTKVGLLSVFGTKGTQSKLDKTFSGSGELQGLANSATGFAGNAENREGDRIGTKLKDTGAGGKGTATVGISGLGTKGKGTGTYGIGSGGIGTKGSVDIDVGGQEAEFVGTIDREAIRKRIQENRNAIRSCYERSLQRKPDLYGKLVLEWDIEEKGKVGRAVVKSNSLGDDEVAQCILNRIRSLRFPDPPADTTARVSYPFVFSSQ